MSSGSQRWVISIQREMEWLEKVVSRKPPTVRFSPRTWQPAIDVYETDEEVVVLIELAGGNQDEIELLVQSNILIVKGERRDIKQGIKRTYSQMEILWGPFERDIALPANVDAERVIAFYEAGFLEVILPKLT
ncbi:MAG: Hsp20/alpha crystallin family protein [Chloroflexota bacterium]|nr:Hsp20/alpha crystallin family protein [Chloroflexota bacterium]